MGGFMGVAAKQDCVFDLYFGIDYHSHLGTRRGGMVVYDKEKGFDRSIHNIENAPFRTKFDKDMQSMKGKFGIGCISDYEPQPLIVREHHGTYAITTVSKINNTDELVVEIFEKGGLRFFLYTNLSHVVLDWFERPYMMGISGEISREDMHKMINSIAQGGISDE